jgi:hypothetical protein
VERAHCHGIFGLSDYHQERTSPTYSQRKNNPRQLHPHPKRSCAQNVVVLKINQRNPKCQNIDELRTAILQVWQQFLQERLRRLVRSMTRRVTELYKVFRWCQTLARPSIGRSKKRLSSDQWTRLHVRIVHPK